MADLLTLASLAFMGLSVGSIAALIGLGGGFIIVPVLILVYGLEAQKAVGTSLATALFTALSGSLAYHRQRRIDWKLGLATAATSVPAASLGAYSTTFFTAKALAFAFGILLMLMALRILLVGRVSRKRSGPRAVTKPAPRARERGWSRVVTDSRGDVFEYRVNLLTSLGLLFGGGFVAGLLGVGGGMIIVPIYTGVMGVPVHIAVATSMFAMIFTAVSGTGVHASLGNVLWVYLAPLVVGIIAGTQIGASHARRLRGRTLEDILGSVVLIAGLWMAVSRPPF